MQHGTLVTNPLLKELGRAVKSAEEALKEAANIGNMTPANTKMSEALTHLVETVGRSDEVSHDEMIGFLDSLGSERLKRLHGWLSEAEAQMELHVAKEFCEKPELSRNDLEQFIYWNNYAKLTKREADAFNRVFKKFDFKETPRFVFVGSGPLPLTGLLLQEQFPGSSVVCWDIDPQAVEVSSQLKTKLGRNNFEVKLGTGLDETFGPNDVLVVAALVQPKGPIIDRALEADVSFFATRDARGASRVLYEPTNLRELGESGLLGVGFADSGKQRNKGVVVDSEHVVNTLQILVPKTLIQSLSRESQTFQANRKALESSGSLVPS